MCQLKFSFTVVGVTLAVGLTIAFNAKSIGSRVVTACFEQVILTDGTPTPTTLVLPIANRNCDQTKIDIISNGAYWLNAVPSVQRAGCRLNLSVFCCAEFDIDVSAPTGVPNVVPQSGYASGKYRVTFVLCRK